MSFKYEIGDEFKTRLGNFRCIADRRVSKSGCTYYWIVDEDGEPSTYVEGTLNDWIRVEPFFRIGDTFTSPWDSHETMTVTHIDNLMKSAWVTVTSEEDSPRKESYGVTTWRRVKDEILKNRSN